MITDWLGEFLHSLDKTFDCPDWPDVETDSYGVFYEDWRKAFSRHGISQTEAVEARSLMAEDPPRFRAQFLPKLLVAIRALREVSADTGRGGVAPGGRASAEMASKGCCYCEGGGLAVVYASKPDLAKKIAETSAAYCVCSHGQWIEANHREHSPDIHARIPHMARVLIGRSFWRQNPLWMDEPAPIDHAEIKRPTTPQRPDPQCLAVSKDCPECEGKGWAKRRAKWHSLPRPFVVTLFCRCPVGSWRAAHDPDPKRNHDSLQANPEIWDPKLSHPTWSDRPIAFDVETAPGSEGLWRYLRPDEPDEPGPEATGGGPTTDPDAGPKRPRPDWLKTREEKPPKWEVTIDPPTPPGPEVQQ